MFPYKHGDVIEFEPGGAENRWMFVGGDRWVNRFASVSRIPADHSVWEKPHKQVL